MQQLADFIRNHPIYIIDAIVLVIVVIQFRKKAQQDRQAKIDFIQDSIAAEANVVTARENESQTNHKTEPEPGT